LTWLEADWLATPFDTQASAPGPLPPIADLDKDE